MDSKALPDGTRRGRRGAIAGLLAGTAMLVGHGGEAKARRKRCPQNACPRRTCCVCEGSSPTPGRRFGRPATTLDELVAACAEACGGAGAFTSPILPGPNQSVACDATQPRCHLVRRPL